MFLLCSSSCDPKTAADLRPRRPRSAAGVCVSGARVTVSIGAPRPYPDGADFYCPYRIESLGDDRVKWVGGVDAVQALQLVMERIGIELYASPKASVLRWIDPDDPDLGFPVPENLRDVMPKRPREETRRARREFARHSSDLPRA